jgi:hypothetical protein
MKSKPALPALIRSGSLLILIGLAVVPYAWLGQQWPWLGRLLVSLFASEAAHALGHAAIFTALGVAMLGSLPGLRARAWPYVALILAVALAQEGFQLLVKGRGVILNDLTDIGTDLVAAGVVFALARAVGVQEECHDPSAGR